MSLFMLFLLTYERIDFSVENLIADHVHYREKRASRGNQGEKQWIWNLRMLGWGTRRSAFTMFSQKTPQNLFD